MISLGRSETLVSRIGLGCYSMSNAYGGRNEDESRRVIRSAIDVGVNLIDTADFYGHGHNEELVAAAIAGGMREHVFLSSKFGYVRGQDGTTALRGDARYVGQACDASLTRLRTDRLDLYFQHRVDPQVPIEETVGAMANLVTAGKVRHLGLCEVSERTLRRAVEVHPIAAVQIEYSLWTRDAEASFLATCAELGITVMAFSPLARGMLTGSLRTLDQLAPDDSRRRFPRFSPENFAKNVALVDRLQPIAQHSGCSIAQVALAWILAKQPDMVAICGSDTSQYLDENLDALKVRLTNSQVEELSELFAPGRVAGDRYHPAAMAMLDR